MRRHEKLPPALDGVLDNLAALPPTPLESLERLVRVRKLTVDPAVRSNGEDFSDAFTADVVLDVYYAPTFKAPEAPQVTADAGDE